MKGRNRQDNLDREAPHFRAAVHYAQVYGPSAKDHNLDGIGFYGTERQLVADTNEDGHDAIQNPGYQEKVDVSKRADGTQDNAVREYGCLGIPSDRCFLLLYALDVDTNPNSPIAVRPLSKPGLWVTMTASEYFEHKAHHTLHKIAWFHVTDRKDK